MMIEEDPISARRARRREAAALVEACSRNVGVWNERLGYLNALDFSKHSTETGRLERQVERQRIAQQARQLRDELLGGAGDLSSMPTVVNSLRALDNLIIRASASK